MSIAPTDVVSPLLDDQVAANRRRATVLLAVLALVVAAVVSVLGALAGAGLLGPAIGVAAAAAVALTAYRTSTAVVLTRARARPAGPLEYARLHNLVEGLCAGAGLPTPDVYVVDNDSLNAFVAGRAPRDAVITVTTGLAERLTRIELEGVVAHLLSRVKNLDILPLTLAVTVVGPLSRVLPPAPAARLLDAAVGTRREALADITAVTLTRYPPGLISALEKLRDASTAVQPAGRAAARLWLVNGRLDERIAALREL